MTAYTTMSNWAKQEGNQCDTYIERGPVGCCTSRRYFSLLKKRTCVHLYISIWRDHIWNFEREGPCLGTCYQLHFCFRVIATSAESSMYAITINWWTTWDKRICQFFLNSPFLFYIFFFFMDHLFLSYILCSLINDSKILNQIEGHAAPSYSRYLKLSRIRCCYFICQSYFLIYFFLLYCLNEAHQRISQL